MKDKALARLNEPDTKIHRYRSPDALAVGADTLVSLNPLKDNRRARNAD